MPGKKGEEQMVEAEPSAKIPPQEKKAKKGEKKPAPGPSERKAAIPVIENPNFRHIVRFAETDLDGKRPLVMALTDVRGLGRRVAETITHITNLDPNKRLGDFTEAETEGIEAVVLNLSEKVPSWLINRQVDRTAGESRHLVASSLESTIRDDVNQMRMIRCYRGIRHERGQKVRGQRTKSNGRTGMAAGVMKKTLQEAAARAKAAPEKKEK